MTSNVILPVKKHEFITAIVAAGTKKYNFKQNTTLQNKRIIGLAFHTNEYLTKDPNGVTLEAKTIGIAKGFLTLKSTESVEMVNRLPLYMLAPGVNAGGTYEKFLPVDISNVDFENSYIELADATGVTAGTSFMISVLYEEKQIGCSKQ